MHGWTSSTLTETDFAAKKIGRKKKRKRKRENSDKKIRLSKRAATSKIG